MCSLFLLKKCCGRVNKEAHHIVSTHFNDRMCHIISILFQDFGDYQDGYYSVQTTEGEQIAQLIAGYIDIILKKVTPFTAFLQNLP